MELSTMRDLLVHELADIMSAEGQIIDAMPQLIKRVSSDELKQALTEHLDQTKEQKRRLEKISKRIGQPLDGEECLAMRGLLEEAGHLLDADDVDEDVLDAALVSACQRVEHYEIAAYGSACTFAQLESEEEVLDMLQQSLTEEREQDERLTDVAMSSVNQDALDIDDFEDEEELEEEDEPVAPPRRRPPNAGGGAR